MNKKNKKPFHQYMRLLHRDIGFFVIGLTLIYSLSGILLIYRDTNLFKYETVTEKKLSQNLEANELGRALHMKRFKVEKEEGDIIYFNNGTYNKQTGVAKYNSTTLPKALSMLNSLHKSSSSKTVHWFLMIYGISLFFLAISSFWMFKPGTKHFRRGLFISVAGTGAAFLMLLL